MNRNCSAPNDTSGDTPRTNDDSEHDVHSWRATVPIEGAANDDGFFTRYFDLCTRLYWTLLKHIEQDSNLSKSLDGPIRKLSATFFLWDLIHLAVPLPDARHRILQLIGAGTLHDEAQYAIEGSVCQKCNVGVNGENGIHDENVIIDGLERLTGVLMSSSGIKTSHESQLPPIASGSNYSLTELFSEKIRTEFPETNEDVICRLGKFYENQVKYRQATRQAWTREAHYSEPQLDTTSTTATNVSKFRDSGFGSSALTGTINTATNPTSMTASQMSQTRSAQPREPYPCLFPGCCEQDTVIEGCESFARHFLIIHGPQSNHGFLECLICNVRTEYSPLYSHYMQHVHGLAPAILSNLDGGKLSNVGDRGSSLRSEFADLTNFEVSLDHLLSKTDEQRTANSYTQAADILQTDASSRIIDERDSANEGASLFLPGSAEKLPSLGINSMFPVKKSRPRSASINNSQATAGSSRATGSRYRVSRPKAVQKSSTNPRKPAGQYMCSYDGCTRSTSFTSTHDLKRHERSVHGETSGERYVCAVEGCRRSGKFWDRRDNFRAHVTTQHTREPKEIEKVIERSRIPPTTEHTRPLEHPSRHKDSVADPNYLINNRIITPSAYTSPMSQQYPPLGAEVHDESNMSGFTLTQHSMQNSEQVAASQEHLSPSDDDFNQRFRLESTGNFEDDFVHWELP
ncbi:hypothetical protein AOQ84DRAFT_381988 [Glonium stellatum]|uniref:C2H2-type domain-containing protein n=1 Tax=Glonium stellatum TaxID=574774 RepID=A0A8E2JMW9_9PEZI|nr:hypothetical protein AOQ84DRAFT_381988 [Glonium stellatum]